MRLALCLLLLCFVCAEAWSEIQVPGSVPIGSPIVARVSVGDAERIAYDWHSLTPGCTIVPVEDGSVVHIWATEGRHRIDVVVAMNTTEALTTQRFDASFQVTSGSSPKPPDPAPPEPDPGPDPEPEPEPDPTVPPDLVEVPAELVEAFDRTCVDNELAELYGLTFLRLSMHVERDREVLLTTADVESFLTFSSEQIVAEGRPQPGLGAVVAEVFEPLGDESRPMDEQAREQAALAFRRTGSGLWASSLR